MNIIVQTTGGDASSLNGKSGSPNKTLANITGAPLMYLNLPLDSCFKWILRFSMLKASVDLPQPLWLYALLLHTPLGFHSEANVHLLISSNFLTLH